MHISHILGPNNFDRNPRYDYGTAREAKNSLVFRNSEDCTLSGLHVTNVWRDRAGLWIENCRRMNVSDSTILDCDQVGLLLENVTQSRISGCLIRDDRPEGESIPLKTIGGSENVIAGNMLDAAPQIAPETGVVEDNVYP